ncbi:hypothetical protein Tco_0545945, partial [Tanacetum coccineum]
LSRQRSLNPEEKATKRRQSKKVVQDEDKQCIAWTPKEEIALFQAWICISEDSIDGNDYTHQAITEYQVEYGVSFARVHCWGELKDCPKWKGMELPRILEHGEEKHKRYKDRANNKGTASTISSTSGNEDVLTRDQKDGGGIKDTRGQNARSRKTSSRDGITSSKLQFYWQPHDHLSKPELEMTLDLKRAIKERWNLQN